MLDVYYWPTPNGCKVTILLHELGAQYNLHPVDIGRGDQFKADLVKISPNRRIPVLVDRSPKHGVEPVALFESGAILMYLAEKHGRFWPQELSAKYEVVKWLMWQ